ncbi:MULTISPECIES: Bug family tripartite tricarboxylate transporter substrate binding protein [Pseudomonas]|jgi:tripartite-type tricarboxylate transporter receptor subunit TctC|uniref:Bug family tripartite tricarboxylate transporter substrate binding protein n=1 Tax=Pseudomonas TaxID=286 RepID=UPI0021F71641|nr:tripartite tricarboxylate transporter substrate binding protein [Pseudomonas sp. BT-42-2]MCV9918551.1 tripartite tricarboxylate transporter substrate binding protein [Pseudomonas sp. BT-42-2]
MNLKKLILATLALSAATLAQADNWPSRPLTLIVPFPPGGAADTVGRYYAEQLSTSLGQPVVVDNKPGAGTAIAAEAVAKAKPDGYTLSLATAGQLAILPNLQAVRYDPIKDFTPVAVLASVPNVVAVGPKTKVDSLQALIDQAKAKPGALSYSSCGNGTLCHLSGELLKNLAGVDLLHVPYKGSAPAVTGLLGGEVDVAVDTLTVLAPQIQAGKLKGLVLTSAERSPLLPSVPSANEVGLPGFVASGWFGIVLPKGAEPALVERLNNAIEVIADKPETAERFGQQGISVERSSPAGFAQVIAADKARWGEVIRTAQVHIE